jgi:hypothetical protein
MNVNRLLARLLRILPVLLNDLQRVISKCRSHAYCGSTHIALAHGVHCLLDVGNDQIIDGSTFRKGVPELDQRREESGEGCGLREEVKVSHKVDV